MNKLQQKFQRARQKARLGLRDLRESKQVALEPAALAQCRFYQFKQGTAEFFFARYGRTDIRVPDTPHFHLARALAQGDAAAVETATAFYMEYLAASWGPADVQAHRDRVAAFRAHFEAFRDGSAAGRPVIVTRLGAGGDHFVVDGNHRVAFAVALGKKVPVKEWPLDLAFERYSRVPEFYGTSNRNQPYQSVYFQRNIVITGRRDDILERLGLIPAEVLQGMRLLDIASNIGMSSILARGLGAASVLGIERSSGLVDLASRFAMFEGVHEHVKFRQFDIDSASLRPGEEFDTAFIFSIYNHLRSPERLTRIVEQHVRRYVVFEAHPGDSRAAYAPFFDSGLFSSVEELGSLSESVYKRERNRLLWLCRRA